MEEMTIMKRVLVTGGSRGIGAAICERIARTGFHAIVNFQKDRAAAELVVSRIGGVGGSASLLPFDVSNREGTRTALEGEIARNGVPWGVVLNAGIALDAPFPVLEDDMWDRVIGTNLNGFYNVLKPIVMPLVNAHVGGRIVAMSSISGITGNRGQVNYAATKAGIIGATRSLAQELARRAITVNAVAPGLIETDMTAGLPVKDIVKLIPMRRFGTAMEVAGVVDFLLSDAAAYITGQVISVNGGMA